MKGTASIGGAQPQAMGSKKDLVVWLKLQPMQRRIYEACQECLCTLTSPIIAHCGTSMAFLHC